MLLRISLLVKLCFWLCLTLGTPAFASETVFEYGHTPQQNYVPSSTLPDGWQKHEQTLKQVSDLLDTYFLRLAPVYQQLHDRITVLDAKSWPLLVDIPAAQAHLRNSTKVSQALLGDLSVIQSELAAAMRDITALNMAVAEYSRLIDEIDVALKQVPPEQEIRAGVSLAQLRGQLNTVTIKRNKLTEWMDKIHTSGQKLQSNVDNGLQQLQSVLPALWWRFYTTPFTQAELFAPAPPGSEIGIDSAASFSFTVQAFLVGVLVLCLLLSMSARHAQDGRRLTTALSVGFVTCGLVLRQSMESPISTVALNPGLVLMLGFCLCLLGERRIPKAWVPFLPLVTGWVVLNDYFPPNMAGMALVATIVLALVLSWAWLHRNAPRTALMHTCCLGAMAIMALLGYAQTATVGCMAYVTFRAWGCLPMLCGSLHQILTRYAQKSQSWSIAVAGLLAVVLLAGITFTYIWLCPGMVPLAGALFSQPVTVFGVFLPWENLAAIGTLFLLVLAVTRHLKTLLISRSGGALDPSAVPAIHAVLGCMVWGGFGFVALALMGLDVRSLAFIGGGLSVGLGFGLQHVMSNFFSGLVLIFSRAVKENDLIEVGGTLGHVRSISTRSTVLETPDSATIIVPNVEMLNTRVVNWTKTNKHVRCDLTVGVSQQCSPALVIATLEAVAAQHPDILTDPPAEAFLAGFGPNTLEFILRVWLRNLDHKMANLSAIRSRIYDAFREQGIEIAFPQLDVTIKSAHKNMPHNAEPGATP